MACYLNFRNVPYLGFIPGFSYVSEQVSLSEMYEHESWI